MLGLPMNPFGLSHTEHGVRRSTRLRPETLSQFILALVAALLLLVTVYGSYVLVRHVHVADHARLVTTALLLNETVGELDRLRATADRVGGARQPVPQDEFRRRMRDAAVRLDTIADVTASRTDLPETTLRQLREDLRQAIEGTANPQAGGDTTRALVDTLNQAVPELNRVITRLHTDAQTSNMAHLRTLRRDHWMLVALLASLAGCGIVLILMAIRHGRLLSSAHTEVDALVDHLRETGAELRTQNARFEAALTNMSQALCVADSDQRIVVCNSRFNTLLGLTDIQTRPGTPVADLFEAAAENGQLDRATVAGILTQHRQLITAERPGGFTQETEDGRAVAVSHQAMPGGGWVATYEDVTDRRQAEARIRFMGRHDCLTRLPNRAALIERLASLPNDPRLDGEQLAVMTINLDHFRSFNDSMGHDAGDLLLKAAADRLRGTIRDSDFVARTGSDEFVVLRLSNQHPADAERLARQILAVMATPYEIDRQFMSVTASMGIAISAEQQTDPDLLLTHADTSLERAKAEGRGTYRFFDPEMDARVQMRRAMEHDLREALIHGDFRLAYQPIWDLAGDRVSGFEALLRWVHPARGVVSPGEFIPLAEELGLIGPIGAWAIQQACRDAAQWPAEIAVSVNLSAVQFQDDRLGAVIEQALADARLPPNRLILEITETVLLADDARTVATLHELRRRGIRISLDDFGTGYSSLRYLVSFPFDKLKIDQSFVRDMTTRADCWTIVSSIVSLAKQLGIATTAEGVETAEQLDLIRSIGCTEAQGFHFSQPESAQAIRRWFEPAALDP